MCSEDFVVSTRTTKSYLVDYKYFNYECISYEQNLKKFSHAPSHRNKIPSTLEYQIIVYIILSYSRPARKILRKK